MNVSDVFSWVIAVAMLAVLVALAVAVVWLFRQRRREKLRAELAEQLEGCVQRLGLGTVWQAPLFQADVYGIRGIVEDFDVRAELWDKSSRDFFRLSIHFPQPTAQTFRVLTRGRKGIEHLWRMNAVQLGDEVFDECFQVYSRRDDAKRIAELFESRLREGLVGLEGRVDGMKLGNHSLYLYVERAVEPSFIEQLIADALGVARSVFSRAAEVGSVEKERKAEYAMASVEMLSRQLPEGVDEGEFPEGSDEILAEKRESGGQDGSLDGSSSGSSGGGSDSSSGGGSDSSSGGGSESSGRDSPAS